VVVMKEDGSGPEALYSQAAVLAYLFHHLPHFRVIARKMVQQVGNFSQQVGAHKPLHVAEDAPLLEAFRLLRDQVWTPTTTTTTTPTRFPHSAGTPTPPPADVARPD
jgi:hypothetical protein